MDPLFTLFFMWEAFWLFCTISGPFYSVLNCFRYSRMSDLTVLTEAWWNQRMTGTPSGPTRNFSKFQRMSWTFMGSQKSWFDEPKRSEVGGQQFWSRDEKNRKTSFLPLLCGPVLSTTIVYLTLYISILKLEMFPINQTFQFTITNMKN